MSDLSQRLYRKAVHIFNKFIFIRDQLANGKLNFVIRKRKWLIFHIADDALTSCTAVPSNKDKLFTELSLTLRGNKMNSAYSAETGFVLYFNGNELRHAKAFLYLDFGSESLYVSVSKFSRTP